MLVSNWSRMKLTSSRKSNQMAQNSFSWIVCQTSKSNRNLTSSARNHTGCVLTPYQTSSGMKQTNADDPEKKRSLQCIDDGMQYFSSSWQIVGMY